MGSNPTGPTKFRETLWSAGRACGDERFLRVVGTSESESRETVPQCMVPSEMLGQSRRSCRPPKHTGEKVSHRRLVVRTWPFQG